MYIIVIGGGIVGYPLCRALLSEGHEVLVIEKDAKRCDYLEDNLGSVCIRGDGCEAATLEEAGTARADIFVATTTRDEDNLMACQVAKYKFKVAQTIALVNDPVNEELFRKLGVDYTVSVVTHLLEPIKEEIPTGSLIHLLSLRDEGMEVVEVRIPQDSKAVKKPVRELALPPDCILALVIRKEQKPQVPTLDTVLEAGDRVIALTRGEDEAALQDVFIGS